MCMNERLESLKRKNQFHINGKVDIRPRHQALLAIEGWYSTNVDYSVLPNEYRVLADEYVKSGSSLKFTRWLIRNGHTTIERASKLGSKLKPVTFKISCRHNDLLRLADTHHYASCFASWRSAQQLRYLADPDVAVVYVPDEAGKFKWRAILRLMLVNNEHVLLLYRDYGNTNKDLINKKLNKIYPLYLTNKTSFETCDSIQLEGVTRHNNKIVGHHVWSDHWCKLINNKIQMYGVRYDK